MGGTDSAVLAPAPKTLVITGYGDGRGLLDLFAGGESYGRTTMDFLRARAAAKPMAPPGDVVVDCLTLESKPSLDQVRRSIAEREGDLLSMEDIGRFFEEHSDELKRGTIICPYEDLPLLDIHNGGTFNLIDYGERGNYCAWLAPNVAKATTFEPVRFLYKPKRR